MPAKKFSLIPGFQAASISINDLEQIVQVLQEHDVQEVQFTSTRRLGVIGPDKESIEKIGRQLERFNSPKRNSWITYIQSCPGQDQCKYGIRDSQSIGERIEHIQLPEPLKAKVKVGIAGCQMCCTEPLVRDIGLIAENKGWKLTFGGNAGGRARVGDVIDVGLSDQQAIELIRNCLIVYLENAGPKMRTARFMEAYGAEKFIQTVTSMKKEETS
jgi:NAD(P)H-nitrite reductase large subunit